MLARVLIPLCLFATTSGAFAADWKPTAAPLMTKRGKQVTPENAWREYPRPQLVRKDWLNLNGLWNHTLAKATGPLPLTFRGQIRVAFAIESSLSGVGKPLSRDQRLVYHRSFRDIDVGLVEVVEKKYCQLRLLG